MYLTIFNAMLSWLVEIFQPNRKEASWFLSGRSNYITPTYGNYKHIVSGLLDNRSYIVPLLHLATSSQATPLWENTSSKYTSQSRSS